MRGDAEAIDCGPHRSMKRLVPYLRYLLAVRWHFLGGILAGLLYAAASGLGLPLASKVLFPLLFDSEAEESGKLEWYQRFLNDLLGDIDRGQLVLLTCLWLPLIFLLRAVGGYFNAYLITYCGYRVVETLRGKIFERLQQLPVAFFHRFQSGDLLARITVDTEVVRQVIARISGDLIKQPATLLFACGFLVNEALTSEGSFVVLIAIVSIPLCIFPIREAGRKLFVRAKQLQASVGGLSGLVAESLSSPLEVRSYNLQEVHLAKFRGRVKELIRFAMKVVKYRQLISPSIEVVAACGLSVALYLGVQQGMTMESFMAIGIALYMSYEPVKKLGKIHTLIRQGTAALDRIEEVLHATEEIPEAGNPRTPGKFTGEVRFEKVSFRYHDEAVLEDMEVSIPAGQCVALIGPSGAGKSTFANLIPRFFDVSGGRVTVSGIDVREWSKKDLRQCIAVVSQAPVIFSGTIRENILIGRPGASDEEVEEAARKAFAHQFIVEKLGGYDQEVAEQGANLSGGQRQRIALARAFLKDAPILILDEATSALDNESEARIQEALKDLIRDRTTIIIAHRLSTTRIADRILEFDHGRIIAERSPAEVAG